MTSPLKITREKKLGMIRELHGLIFDMGMKDKGELDRMDFRVMNFLLFITRELASGKRASMKEISDKMNKAKEKRKGASSEHNNFCSIEQPEMMP